MGSDRGEEGRAALAARLAAQEGKELLLVARIGAFAAEKRALVAEKADLAARLAAAEARIIR